MKRPWMPLYVTDYLTDTLDLSAEEHGCYLLLMMLCWRRPNCDLPNDMEWLKRSVRSMASDMHGNRFNRIVPRLLERFFKLDIDGMWRQPRLVYEREKAENFSGIQKENANKRWMRKNKINSLEDAVALPARARQSQSHINITTTSRVERGEEPSNGNAQKRPDQFSRTELEEAFAKRRGGNA